MYWTEGALANETFDEYASHPMQAVAPGCDPGACDRQQELERGWFLDLPALRIGGRSDRSRAVRREHSWGVGQHDQ